MITLDRLAPDDWKRWRALRLAALAEAPYAFGATLAEWSGDGDAEPRWRQRLELGGVHLVAVLDGEDVGMASGIHTDRPDAAAVISMWVAPAGRGRGVGDALLAEIADWARSWGASYVDLNVAGGNVAAEQLYRRNGFDRTDEVEPDSRCELVMRKRL